MEELTKVKRVQKRDGQLVLFDEGRITDCIFKAVKAVGQDDYNKAKNLSFKVCSTLEIFFKGGVMPTVEMVQDLIEKVLIESSEVEIAKAYILYRDQRRRLRDEGQAMMNVTSTMDGYLKQSDWRVAENANMNYSLSGLLMHAATSVFAHYTLNNVYPKEIADAHRNGDLHLHDLGMGIAGYCAGWSLRQLLTEGFNGVPGKIDSKPAKHLDSALWQIINFIGTLQNEWAGAQAFSSFDTYLAPLVKADNLPYEKVKQAMQGFIFNMNVPTRWGGQCVSQDTECLTNNGWKFHNEIDLKTDKIATFNINTQKVEYLNPERVKAYDYDGYLIRLKNRTQDQLVTPNHKVVRKIFNTQKYVLEEAEELFKLKTGVIIPNSASTKSKKEITDSLVELIAWLVSEGTFSEDRERISIFQSEKNKDNATRIRKCLRANNLRWDETKRIHGFGNNPLIRFRLNQESSKKIRKFINSKQVPTFIKTLSKRQIELFIHTYILGDGNEEKNGRIRIYTIDEGILDSIQELCALCEYGTTVYQRKNGVYTINLIRNKDTIVTLSRTKYNGKVWCPTTKNGTFIARRNGRVFITGNTPFSNLTFDWVVPEDMRNKNAIVGGKEMNFTYGDCQKEMDLVNRAFIEVITDGDAKGRVFTFPIPTYNVTNDFNWENDNATLLFEMTAKYGIPYFQNFINSELKPSDVRSMCCRLQMDMRELRQKGGGLFGAVEMTGSVGVVTINLPRIGYLAKTKEEFFEKLSKLMDLSKESLEIKRKLVQRNMDNGLMPFTKRYLGTMQNHFNTIGINGMNEALQNFFGADVTMATKKGIAFAEEVLDFMRDRLKKFQEETGNIYNLEATPAEGVSYRFAKVDKEHYPDIISAGKENPFYTNSTQLPVNYTTDIFEALELQDGLQVKYTGGTVLHGFLGERVSDIETCKKLVKRIAYNFRLPYFTITPTFSICPKHGYVPGRHEICPYEDGENEKNSGEMKPTVYS